MDEDLLRAYDRELSYLRRAGAEFARAHPKIAGRLRLGPDQIEDPHVSRLIESVAFLNARIARKLDDEFPELSDALLSVLAPHFLAPIPSMAVIRLECAADLSGPARVPRGTALVTDSAYGEPCRYRTAYDVEALPVLVESVRLLGAPFHAPATPRSGGSASLLHVHLEHANKSGRIGALAPERLRFFLNGEFRHMAALYELILNDALEVAIASGPADRQPQVLPPGCLQPVGFEPEHAVLPDSARSHPGQRLLSEFFAFPEKFLYFEVQGLKCQSLGRSLHLFVYLRRSLPELEQRVQGDTLALGCTPIVNLFERRAEPIRVSGAQSEYHLIADARHQLETEVHSVDFVRALGRSGESADYAPFYGLGHGLDPQAPARYWHAARRPSPSSEDGQDRGTEIFLALVDEGFAPGAPEDWVLEVETTCLNRNLPAQLPFGGGHPRLLFSKGGGAIKRIACLTAPTQTARPARGRGAQWRLVSLLALDHASLVDGPEATHVLREMLRLFDAQATPATRAIGESVLSVQSRPVVRRIVVDGQPGYCRGLEVRLHLDEERLRPSGTFLFAALVERFLGGYCGINSFAETVVTTTQRDGELRRWPPRAGDRILL